MLSKVKENLFKKELIRQDEKILCAVSGGKDSMAMVHALIALKLEVGIAHVNHNTRSGESDLDAHFVANFASANDISYYEGSFVYDQKGNFQSNARRYRYSFFKSIMEEYNYSWLATGHHLQDSIETVLLNMSRGTGISGLTGIPFINQNIIRPLSNVSLLGIHDYIKQNDIEYREDSTNSTDNYQRNKIRHHLIPAFKKLDTNYENGINKTINNLKRTDNLLKELLSPFITKTKYGNTCIEKFHLNDFNNKAELLYHSFSSFGFNYDQIQDIITSEPGSKIETKEWVLVNDRSYYTLIPNKEYSVEINVNGEGIYLLPEGRKVEVELSKNPLDIPFSAPPFPFKIRSRKAGDRFSPIGMKGRSKKMKKYLIDEKYSWEEKRYLLLVEKENEILSIVEGRKAHQNIDPSVFVKIKLL